MEKVIVINTGGTIAMSIDEHEFTVTPGENHALHHILPLLNQYADVEMDDFLNLPSPHITLNTMVSLAQRTQSYLDNDKVAGVVITHGTDTLEETAFFLDLTIKSDKPVILTGAMRSSDELGADGPINLVHSVRVAADEGSKNRGAMIVFNDEIHAARYVTKTHTSNVSTFQSPQHGPVGLITAKKITFFQPPLPRETFTVSHADANVPLIKAVTGMSSDWLRFLLEKGVNGVVIEAFGQGNLPPGIMPVIKRLTEQKTPVVIVSRCINGFVQDTYGYEGGGKQLKEMGVIFCNGLNGPKARIKLIVSLEVTRDLATLETIFNS